MGFKYKEYIKGIDNDADKRVDIRRYRNKVFLPQIAVYTSQFMMQDDNLNIIPNADHQSGEVQPIILVIQDECTFNANEGPYFIQVYNQQKPLCKKEDGQGFYISEFFTPIGQLSNGEAIVSLKWGGNMWQNRERLLDQVVSKAMPVFEAQLPLCKALFAFNNVWNYLKYASDALHVSEMNLEPSGKNSKSIWDIFVTDIVTGGLYRKTDSKIATVLKTQS